MMFMLTALSFNCPHTFLLCLKSRTKNYDNYINKSRGLEENYQYQNYVARQYSTRSTVSSTESEPYCTDKTYLDSDIDSDFVEKSCFKTLQIRVPVLMGLYTLGGEKGSST